ncbi:MAG: leucine-rich repeat domain-containing protein [Clostridiales bacterium]|nr:leucine-rich repeat domain-containing protein [Clostridiales bacterium]
MKKKFLVCVLISAAALSAAAFAGCNLFGGGNNDVVEQNGMRFDLKSDGTYELSRYSVYLDGENGAYTGSGEEVEVPNKVSGKVVTSLSEGAFGGTAVRTVTLPQTITEISASTFSRCDLLESITCSPVTAVGDGAFYLCPRLGGITLGEGLTEIGARAFEGCTQLTTITLPDTCVTLKDMCFESSGLINVEKSDGVQTVGDRAFWECGISAISLPEVVSIGDSAFYNCGLLREISVGDNLENVGAGAFRGADGVEKLSINSPVPASLCAGFTGLETLELGAGVTKIGNSAFKNCTALKSVILPAALTDIGDSAFFNAGLTSVNIPASVKTVGEYAFAYDYLSNDNLATLTIENGLESIGESAFYRTAIASLNLPSSVKEVGREAFYGCNLLTEITLNEGLESLGVRAFSITGAVNMNIELPSTVKSVGTECFADITANKIIINGSVETVGENILNGAKVKELEAPACVKVATATKQNTTLEKLTVSGTDDIPDYAYRYCMALKSVTVGEGVKHIGSYAFAGLEKLRLGGVETMGSSNPLGDISALEYTKTKDGVNYIDNWIISTDYSKGGGATNLDLSGVTGIYQNAFRKTTENDTSTLTTVALISSQDTSNIKFIGKNAFRGTGITGIEVPASVQVWDEAFYGCEKLNAITVQSGVEKIANNAFNGCTNLTGVNLAATDITEIGDSAFASCQNLRNVTLPDGVKKIGDRAFSECGLLSVDLKGAEEIGNNAFYHCTALREVAMGAVKTIGNNAFYSCAALEEIDLPASVTEIGSNALGGVLTVNYAGTADGWTAIDKYMSGGEIRIWNRANDLKVIFGDGSFITLTKSGN